MSTTEAPQAVKPPEAGMAALPVPMTATCLNCEAPLTGRYCSKCAQRTHTPRMDWKWLGHELVHGIFHVDRGILFTLMELFTRPGHAVRDYLEGKRKRYFPPFTLVAILALAGSLLMQALPVDFDQYVAGGAPPTRPDEKEFRDAMKQGFDLYIAQPGVFYMAMVPFMALATWFSMRKYGHGFIEHVVINTFISGQLAAVSFVTWPLSLVKHGFDLVGLIGSVAMVSATLWTFIQFYDARRGWRVSIRVFAAFGIMFLEVLALVIGAFIIGLTAGYPDHHASTS